MANELYAVRGTSITWTDSGGDKVLDLGGLAADAVRVGAYLDRGAAAGPDEYEWCMIIDGYGAATPPVVGESIDLYFAQSHDTTEFDGQLTTLPTDIADAANNTTAMLKNMLYAGSAINISTTAADELIARGRVRLTSRYVSPVVHNNSADVLLGTADAHKVILTPIYYQVQ